jgi:hypothetical protein
LKGNVGKWSMERGQEISQPQLYATEVDLNVYKDEKEIALEYMIVRHRFLPNLF